MSTVSKLPGDGAADSLANQSLTEPSLDHLRNLVLNYLCHNCYLKTAEAFAKDSAIRHLDKDGDEIYGRTSPRAGDTLSVPRASSSNLSDEMVRNILLRQRIQLAILSGNVQEAIDLLNRHFPVVLAEDNNEDEMEVTDENANPSRLEYMPETVNPTHLSLNLRILGFIEACRTIPLAYTPPTLVVDAGHPMDTDSPVAPWPTKQHPKDDEHHQSGLLIYVRKLYATVNALSKPEDRTIYLKELQNVGGLLAYTVPEKSPMARYLHQERRDRVAEQINSAILHHTNMPPISYLELAVRYTHCVWAMLHESRVKVPAAYRLIGASQSSAPQGTGESGKETSQEARPFDLQAFLNTKT